MIAEALINQMIPALKYSDKAEKAIIWMEELKTNMLPVVHEKQFRGLITEDSILESNDLNARIEEFQLIGENCYVTISQHLFDIIKTAQEQGSELVAVVEDDGEFLGVSSYEDTIMAFANTATIQAEGGIIVLSLTYKDYSLTDISRIIESNNAKIMGLYVSQHPSENEKVLITLKLNTSEMVSIIASLQQYKFEVVARFNEFADDDDDKNRIEHLLRFIDM
ncbi:MAG TPA: cbs domain containing protein [Cytophagales bacterium]|jgi:acetoin utilization protein AcuB|nr:cbs domain containing protein [Cytophagales bacterium]